MKAIMTALEEVYGLFVEDGSLAALILIWIAIAIFVFPHVSGSSVWRGPTFFAGLALMLLENVRRSARR
jgi:hypothetical protein